jgi:hypothetical protein
MAIPLSGLMTFAAISAEVPPTFQWAKQLAGTGTGHVWVYGHCIDEVGNSYLAGSFRGDILVAGAITLTNGSIFLVKFDRNGNVLWARQDGAVRSERWRGQVTGISIF